MRSTLAVSLAVLSAQAAAEPAWVDARVSATVQLFEQGLVPGQPGAVTRVEPAFPFTVGAFARGGVPFASGTVSAELAAWGRVGPRDGVLGDGDVTAAWAQLLRGPLHLRLGRQVTLPGASRYVRFDGLSAGLAFEHLELDVYAGWVALPRWNQPRGAVLAGFAGDALEDLQLREAQNRAGQIALGARAAFRSSRFKAGLGFHEQRDGVGLAYRVVSADVLATPADFVAFGGRVSFDLAALAVPEARVYADFQTPIAPLSIDYSYQSPALLLPKSSILAAFGGTSWHELGAETTAPLSGGLKVTARGAAQLFEGDQPGGKGSLKLSWSPGPDGRVLVLGEAGRALVPPSGFTWMRLAARVRATAAVAASLDTALYLYDQPVRGQKSSVTAIASLEWAIRAWLKATASATAMSTPYAAFELQGLGRLVFELEPTSAGGAW